MGGASYGNAQAAARGRVVADVRDDQIAQYEFSGDKLTMDGANVTTLAEARKVPTGGMMKKGSGNAGPPPPAQTGQAQAANEVQRMAQQMQQESIGYFPKATCIHTNLKKNSWIQFMSANLPQKVNGFLI
jgi:hypothetical protein